MYAIVSTGGKQVKVSVGDKIFVEKLEAEVNSEYVFENVLLVEDDKAKVKVGAPFVKGASVKAKVLKQGRGKKIVIFKYRPKKHSASKKGHRQAYTALEVLEINA